MKAANDACGRPDALLTHVILLAWAMVCVLALQGCQRSSDGDRSPTDSEREPEASAQVTAVSTPGAGDGGGLGSHIPSLNADTVLRPPLELRVEAPLRVRSGEAVPVRIHLRNAGSRTEIAPLGAGLAEVRFDLIVTRQDGVVVWHRARETETGTFPGLTRVLRLKPGETLTLVAEWRQQDYVGNPVPPGTYMVRGVLWFDEGPRASQPVEVEIVLDQDESSSDRPDQ